MRYINKILSLIILSGCILTATAYAGKITVTGKAANFTGDTLVFSYEPYKLLEKLKEQKVPVKNGAFSFTVESDVAIRGFFSFGKVPANYHVTVTMPDGRDSSSDVSSNDPRMVFLYLLPGSRINMKLDVNNIEQTLQFAGTGVDDNIFVNKEEWILDSYTERVLRNYHEPVYFRPDAFVALTKKRFDYKIKFLDSMSARYRLSPGLKDIYYWKFYAEWISAKLNYPKTHEMYTSEKVTLPPGYFDFVKEAKTAPTGGDKGTGYFYYLDNLMRKKYDMNTDTSISFDAFIKQNMTGRACYEYLAYTLNKNFKPEILEMFGKNCPYPDLAQLVADRYKKMKDMLPGNPAPAVKLLAADGKVFSFADYKGTYLYIDFWATWCGPCIKEIPSLLKLEKEYQDKNITFLSVSFDKEADAQKWKDFIKNNAMSSHQLRADAGSHALLTSKWNISMIPRFAILDKQGNIVDANAPFPSSKEVRPVLNKLH